VNILCIQETKWKGQKAKEVKDIDFKLWYTGNTSTKNGVGIVLDKRLKDGGVDIKRQASSRQDYFSEVACWTFGF
jgi:exonuclease III